jgi:hypothetical protein
MGEVALVLSPPPLPTSDPNARESSVHDRGVFIEVLDKHDSIIARHRYEQLPVTIGSAYRSDFIVDLDAPWDRALKPISLVVGRDESGDLSMFAQDGSIEFWAPGGMTRRWAVDAEASVSVAGQRLRLRTRDYIPSASSIHARSTGGVSKLLRRAWIWALPAAVAVFAGMTWQSDIDGTKGVAYLSAGLGLAMALLIWSGLWALISRVTGRSSHFLTHVGIAAMAFVALSVFDHVFDTAAFSFNLPALQRYDYALIGVVMGLAVWCHGHLVAKIKNVTAIITAVLAGGALFASQAAGFYAWRGNIASSQTLSQLRPPALRAAKGTNTEAFFDAATSLQERAEKSKPEKPDGIDTSAYDD